MTTMWETVTDVYQDYMSNGDPRVTHWFLMSSPIPTIVMVILYIAFVKVIGPSWMTDRKPFDLRLPMFAYNMGLVITNTYLIGEAVKALSRSNRSLICLTYEMNDPDGLRLAELGWWFYFLKLVEFTDTIFFVLRKKFQQISSLHVVHHALVPIAVWFGFRVEPSNYNYFFPLLNSIVHCVMYCYYGLSALGPHVQKYLWWKKYLTTFQMVQFVTVFIYIMSLLLTNCRVSKFIIYLNIFLAGLFLLMFYDYFRSTYIKKKGSVTNNSRSQSLVQQGKASSSQNISQSLNNYMSKESLEKKIG